MKTLLIAIAMVATMSFTTKSAQAQISGTDVLAAAGNLVNVQVGSVNVNLVDVVDVSKVDIDITALNNILNGITIDNVLTNLFRDADIITGNQVVVGVLSDQTTFYVIDKSLLRTNKKH